MDRRPIVAALVAALAAAALIVGCGVSDSDSTSTGAGGTETSTTSDSFQPHATLAAIDGTARTDKPTFVLRVKARPGDDNIRSVAVNLPPVVLVDTTAVGKICSQKELDSDQCADSHPLGSARVLSPAYDDPLTGPVYVVSSPGASGLPGLVYVLSGPATVVLRGKVVSKGGRMQAGVDDVPDTPLGSFELTIDGGENGYLVLSRNICGAQTFADGTFTSQDGQTFEQKIPLQADC